MAPLTNCGQTLLKLCLAVYTQTNVISYNMPMINSALLGGLRNNDKNTITATVTTNE